MYKTIFLFLTLSILLFVTPHAEAHVVVKPNQAGVASYQTFTVGVPNEKDIPTVALKLLIPEGVKSVSPNVKPGWAINLTKNGEGEDAKTTEINWTEGEIPAGQRDDFLFSVQVPGKKTTLNWKTYQTYADGTVVSWDQNPTSMRNISHEKMEELEKKGKGPYSQTHIINDLFTTTKNAMESSDDTHTMLVAYVALALAALSLGLQLRKKS